MIESSFTLNEIMNHESEINHLYIAANASISLGSAVLIFSTQHGPSPQSAQTATAERRAA